MNEPSTSIYSIRAHRTQQQRQQDDDQAEHRHINSSASTSPVYDSMTERQHAQQQLYPPPIYHDSSPVNGASDEYESNSTLITTTPSFKQSLPKDRTHKHDSDENEQIAQEEEEQEYDEAQHDYYEQEQQEPQQHENSPTRAGETKPHVPIWRLALITVSFAGIQFGWALQISQLTPFILELGIPSVLVTLVWLCGPVAGLLVQPLVGAFSDQCTSRWGRRRPFILSGAILVTCSLLLIPNSLDLGHWIGGDTRGKHPVAIALTVFGFWVLDIANNMLQGPSRALVADLAPPEQQETGNALFTFWLGVGNILGFMAGFVPWSTWITFTRTSMCGMACQDLRISFSMSVLVLLATVTVTLIAAKEKALVCIGGGEKARGGDNDDVADHGGQEEEDGETGSTVVVVTGGDEPVTDVEEESTIEATTTAATPAVATKMTTDRPIVHLFRVLFHLPQPMRRICLVQFFNWFAWFTFLIYITVWVAIHVFHGSPDQNDPSYHLFEQGVRYGSFGLAGFAGCSLLFSPFVVWLSETIGTRVVFFMGQLVLATCLCLTMFIRQKFLAVALISLFGVPWSITNTIPFAITANVAGENDKGVFMGILNIFVVVPQLIMSGVGPLIAHLSRGNVTVTLVIGGISALISCIFVMFLIVPPNEHATRHQTDNKNTTSLRRQKQNGRPRKPQAATDDMTADSDRQAGLGNTTNNDGEEYNNNDNDDDDVLIAFRSSTPPE